MERYLRQIELLGKDNQDKLKNSKVLVIGTGGLGSPTLIALTVAGIGEIGLVDFDKVEIHNLNRQTLHDENYIGTEKTTSAYNRLSSLNKTTVIKTFSERLTDTLAIKLFPYYDIIIDCVDNYETRAVVSKISAQLKKPVIEGGIEGFNGYIQIIDPDKTACFNCLGFNSNAEIVRQVLGAGTGIIGSMQALECIKYLTGFWDRSYSYIAFNLLKYQIDTLYLEPSAECSCSK